MRLPISLLYVLAILMIPGYASELMFFADDHYKAVGGPLLKASAINPVLDEMSNSTIRIYLANAGLIEELVPTGIGGSEEDISSEADQELRNVDASNITARLSGSGPVIVTSGAYRVESLPSGGLALMSFNVSAGEGAVGWYNLRLDIEYENQVDYKVDNGSGSSLYQSSNTSQRISVLVLGFDRSFKVEGVYADLYPGANGTIMAVIKNGGAYEAKDCIARLLAAPPFRSTQERYDIGSILPGQAAVIRLPIGVDSGAAVDEYSLDCEIAYDNRTVTVSIPVIVKKSPDFYGGQAIAVLLLASAIGLVLLWRKSWLGRNARRLRRWHSR
jgi:hypothetical protein